MFGRIANRIQAWREDRRQRSDLDPAAFRALARDLTNLAQMAESVWPREHAFHERIKGIQAEMRQLDQMTARPGFGRLPAQQRRTLRESMLKSRAQLIETVTTAPSPTTTLQ